MINDKSHNLTEFLHKVRAERQHPGTTDLPRYLAASDLHGNAFRLMEILATAEREGIAQVFLVGDIYSGAGGWEVYQLLKPLVHETDGAAGKVIPLWGNHELAFVNGMLGSNRQLRFFYGFGGRRLIDEMHVDIKPRGEALVSLSGDGSPTDADLKSIRAHPRLQEMARWIQRTHRLFALDVYGTGYLHACPRISWDGFHVQYDGQLGIDAIQRIEEDLKLADRPDHPVFSPLLQTETSPVWALFEITSAEKFDHAFRPFGVRQLVFGHRHRSRPVNVGNLNRQIGIAVDFDQGLGGYLLVGPQGLTFRSFLESSSHRTIETQLIVPPPGITAAEAYLHDTEEFFVRRLIAAEKELFDAWPMSSRQAEQEFERLQQLRDEGFPWVQRVYAEVHSHVHDLPLRKRMFSAAVESCDEEAFKSFIHFLHARIRELESFGAEWYSEPYQVAKADVEALLKALRDMPLRRLGLLDLRLRGTTSRANLLELYTMILRLQDPDLAVMAIENLGALDHWTADHELRKAFFHDVRRVRVRAGEALASRGRVAYPLAVSLLISRDNWVRFLAFWTVAEIGLRDQIPAQAIADIRNALSREQDWLIYTTGKELLRMLGDPQADDFADQAVILNLTDAVIETLQSIVDSQREPHRKALKIYFITVAISSLVYRRGLIGLDIDELKIYVNNGDYFPPHFRYYKSGDRDRSGHWQGWRRLWIRAETFNHLDGPKVIPLTRAEAAVPPAGHETIVLYDHRAEHAEVKLPHLDTIIARYGLGKLKDQIRDFLLSHWSEFTSPQRALLSRLHAAAVVTMLFNLPGEIFVTHRERQLLDELARLPWERTDAIRKPLLSLERATHRSLKTRRANQTFVARCNWLDAIKFPVYVYEM